MWHREDQPLRQQLIDAREKIVAQLDKMRNPLTWGRAMGPPDFRDQIAELETELCQIDELLSASDGDDA